LKSARDKSAFIKQYSSELEFISCGISRAEFLESEAPRFESWLNNGYNGKMAYMENHFDKRLDPSKLVPGAKSVISLLVNYYPKEQQEVERPKISKYAYGFDYHDVIKTKLALFTQKLTEEFGEFQYRYFVDSAPVLERALAANSGLGWIGKHSLLLSKKRGSFFFIGQIICDLDLEYDSPVTDHCGTCTACIDACPTEAIVEDRVVDSNKCISYLTIELRDEIPSEFRTNMKDWAFGCDICQDVCPWNRFSEPTTIQEFDIRSEISSFSLKDWLSVDENSFRRIFKKSAIKRTKYSGFRRNIRFLAKE